jgi:hypothetical protein
MCLLGPRNCKGRTFRRFIKFSPAGRKLERPSYYPFLKLNFKPILHFYSDAGAKIAAGMEMTVQLCEKEMGAERSEYECCACRCLQPDPGRLFGFCWCVQPTVNECESLPLPDISVKTNAFNFQT